MLSLIGVRSLLFLAAYILTQCLTQLAAGEERSGHAGILDSLLLQVSPGEVEAMLGRGSILSVPDGRWPDWHDTEQPKHPTVSVPPQTRGSTRAEPEFTQCGEAWEPYETVVWSRTGDTQHHIACASALDNETVGICRSDGIGHGHWDYCGTRPSALCDDLGGKLWFAFCADLRRVPAPTPVPPAGLPPDDVLLQTPAPTEEAPTLAAKGHLEVTIGTPVEAGASSIPVPSVEGLSVGDCLLLQGGDEAETVCVAGLAGARRTPSGGGAAILLVSPTIYAYPAGSTLTLQAATSVSSTTAGPDPTTTSAGDGQEPATGTTALHDGHASSRDDPHVCALSGECYDIRAPSEYSLLRVPLGPEERDMLKLSAELGTDGVWACGLFIKSLTLSGSWLGGQAVRVRPHTRDVGGSNWAGTATRTNFSLQLGESPWRSFTQQDPSGQLAVVGRVAVRFVRREQFGDRMEAQSLELAVGGMGPEPARITVSQASHQALNLDVSGLERLGYARVAGVLGTEGHPASIEEPAPECAAAARSATQGATRRQTPQAARKERASTLSASWQ